MNVCLAQISSERGNIPRNIKKHLKCIHRAIELNADLIIFPELSITGYEPSLAEKLAINKYDERFDPFQQLADEHEIVIGVGIPIRARNGIHISMLIFQAKQARSVYSKQILHEDELPYFVPGKIQTTFTILGTKVAFGICYETLQRVHFATALEDGADLYIASVSKPDRGTDKAYLHFPSISKEFQTHFLMVNSIGFCDNFMSNGLSSVWNSQGVLIGGLTNTHEGLLMYNSNTSTLENHSLYN